MLTFTIMACFNYIHLVFSAEFQLYKIVLRTTHEVVVVMVPFIKNVYKYLCVNDVFACNCADACHSLVCCLTTMLEGFGPQFETCRKSPGVYVQGIYV